MGIDANWQISDMLSIQGGVKTELFDDIDLYYFDLGPKISYRLMAGFEGYLQAGGVYGDFDWDNVPENFDDGFGWFAGYGLMYKYNKFRLGLHFTYKKNDYNHNIPIFSFSNRILWMETAIQALVAAAQNQP